MADEGDVTAMSTTRRRWWRTEAASAYAFISPAYLLFGMFIAVPFVAAVVLAFFDFELMGDASFAGLENFRRMFDDPAVTAATVNTLVFTFWSVLLHIGLALPLALAVNRAMSPVLRYFLRTTIFFPMLVSWAAVALIWRYVLDPNFGFITYYLEQLWPSAPPLLIDPGWAVPSIIMVDLWKTLGFTFIILLAGLQAVPRHLVEAAVADGAGPFRRLWHVTLPQLSPTLFFACVVSFIGAFQIFEPMFIMTDGGPGDRTLSLVMHVYETAFRAFELGYASAIALLVFVVVMMITLIQLLLARFWVHYE